MAYDAAYRQDILDGFDTFMDNSLVLPVGQHYDQETLLPILHKLMKKEKEVVQEMTDITIRKGKKINYLYILVVTRTLHG